MHRYVAVRLREEVIRALDELAKRNGVTRSLIIKRGIELVLKQQKQNAKKYLKVGLVVVNYIS